MKDMREHLEKLQVQIAECEMIRDLATDPKKRDLFARLAEHHRMLAGEIEKAIAQAGAGGDAAAPGQAKRFRDKAAEAQQLAEIAETKSRRDALTHIAGNYLRTADQLEGVAKAGQSPKPKDQSQT
jgi:hypothetical protein